MTCRGSLIAAVLVEVLVFAPATAGAEVRFGKNVRIGGHDVSGQTFNRKRRGLFILHRGTPKREGCTWRRNTDGSKTKVCHWQRKSH